MKAAYYKNGTWYDCCNHNIKAYDNGVWHHIKPGSKIYAQGQWMEIKCCTPPDPENWEVDIDGNYYQMISENPTGTPSQDYSIARKTYFNYSIYGTKIYKEGLSNTVDLTSLSEDNFTRIPISTTNFCWNNDPESSSSTPIYKGPLNRSGVWTNDNGNPTKTWIGFSICINLQVGKTYYVGIAADNKFRIKLNGDIIAKDETDNGGAFTYWHVIPVKVLVPNSVITVEGYNSPSVECVGCVGMTIYDATKEQLINCPDVSTLESYEIFNSANKVGEKFDTSSETGWGYTCSSNDLSYNVCSGKCEGINYYTCD